MGATGIGIGTGVEARLQWREADLGAREGGRQMAILSKSTGVRKSSISCIVKYPTLVRALIRQFGIPSLILRGHYAIIVFRVRMVRSPHLFPESTCCLRCVSSTLRAIDGARSHHVPA